MREFSHDKVTNFLTTENAGLHKIQSVPSIELGPFQNQSYDENQ
jgi:hypothetical protein